MPRYGQTRSITIPAQAANLRGRQRDACESLVSLPDHRSPLRGLSATFTLGLRFMIAAAFFFSVMSVLVKRAGDGLPSQQIVLARAVVTLVLSYAALKHAGRAMRGTRQGLLLLRGAVGFVALSGFYYALTHLPLAEATIIQYTNPVLATLLGAIFLRESIGARELVGFVGSLLGVVLIARPGFIFGTASDLDPFAVGVAMGAAMMSACAYVLVRVLRSTEDPMVVVFYFPLVAVPATVVTVWHQWVTPTPVEWLLLLGVGVATQLGQVYMTRGIFLESLSRATSASYLQIVFAFAWGVLLFGERPSLWAAGGAALVIGSTVIVARGKRGSAAPPVAGAPPRVG